MPVVPIKRDVPVESMGNTVIAHIDITLDPPQLRVRDGSGR
jgi:hypothetical protein